MEKYEIGKFLLSMFFMGIGIELSSYIRRKIKYYRIQKGHKYIGKDRITLKKHPHRMSE